MQYKAHDYQEYAKEQIIKKKACGLFLEPGLGKTVITLSAIWDLMFDYFEMCIRDSPLTMWRQAIRTITAAM